MDLQEYPGDKLWSILVDTVHALVMYPSHKAYTREVIIPEKSDITPAELATRLKMPVGEAIVILHELAEDGRTVNL
jgi:ribosomal protein S25